MGNTALPRFGDGQQLDLIDRLERALNALEASPLAGAVVLPPVVFAAYPASLRLFHGLGRAPVGFWAVNNMNTSGVAFVSLVNLTPQTEVDPANYITLASSVASTVTVAVF